MKDWGSWPERTLDARSQVWVSSYSGHSACAKGIGPLANGGRSGGGEAVLGTALGSTEAGGVCRGQSASSVL